MCRASLQCQTLQLCTEWQDYMLAYSTSRMEKPLEIGIASHFWKKQVAQMVALRAPELLLAIPSILLVVNEGFLALFTNDSWTYLPGKYSVNSAHIGDVFFLCFSDSHLNLPKNSLFLPQIWKKFLASTTNIRTGVEMFSKVLFFFFFFLAWLQPAFSFLIVLSSFLEKCSLFQILLP